MKYVLLLTRGAWQENGSEQELAEVFGEIVKWFAEHRGNGTIVEAQQLQAPHTATTVVLEQGKASMIDRPLLEAKEAIGGYAVVEAPDLDAALKLAATFPAPDGKIEVRPLVER